MSLPVPIQSVQSAQNSSSGSKSADRGSEDFEAGLFASFLSSSSQALEKSESEGTSDASLNLTLAALQGETRTERSATLPLILTGDGPSLSNSILDLFASVKEDMEAQGVDMTNLAGEVKEWLGEDFSDLDADRLAAALSRLRDRYLTSVRSDGPNHLNVDVAVGDDLTLALDAALSGVDDDGAKDDDKSGEKEASDASLASARLLASLSNFANLSGVTTDSPADKAEQGKGAEGLGGVLTPRVYSYLKSGARALSEETGNKNLNPEKEGASTEAGPTEKENALPVAAPNEAAGGNTGEGTENPEKDSSRSRSEVARSSSKDGDKAVAQSGQTDETLGKTSSAERRTSSFDEFFSAVVTRGEQSGSSGEVLDLSRGASLSRNETLREGLDNVVRFVRTNGTQKASLIVDPPALGRISVELTSGATGLDASIKVSSEQIRQLVQDQIVQLRMSLEQQGVQVAHFSVDVQQDSEHQRQSGQQQSRNARRVPGENPDVEEETVFRVDLNQGLLYWVA
jgi:flagellar hook-length control protein FliK